MSVVCSVNLMQLVSSWSTSTIGSNTAVEMITRRDPLRLGSTEDAAFDLVALAPARASLYACVRGGEGVELEDPQRSIAILHTHALSDYHLHVCVELDLGSLQGRGQILHLVL